MDLVDIILEDGSELTCSLKTVQYIVLKDIKAVRMVYHDTGMVMWEA